MLIIRTIRKNDRRASGRSLRPPFPSQVTDLQRRTDAWNLRCSPRTCHQDYLDCASACNGQSTLSGAGHALSRPWCPCDADFAGREDARVMASPLLPVRFDCRMYMMLALDPQALIAVCYVLILLWANCSFLLLYLL